LPWEEKMGAGLHAIIDVTGWCLARMPPGVDWIASRILALGLRCLDAGRPSLFSVLKVHFPERDRYWHGQVHHAHLQRGVSGILDLIQVLWGTPDSVMRRVSVINWPQLVTFHQQGVPVILLAGHFIGLPMGVRALAERIPLQVVARMFRHPGFYRPLARLTHRSGGGFIDGGNGRALYRSLRQGKIVLILADYGMAGKTQRTAMGMVLRLANRTGAVVLPLHCQHHGRSDTLHVGAPLPPTELGDAALQALYRAWIVASPAEYLWPRASSVPP
jgi:lauroyl/myristoyl acyltransferase